MPLVAQILAFACWMPPQVLSDGPGPGHLLAQAPPAHMSPLGQGYHHPCLLTQATDLSFLLNSFPSHQKMMTKPATKSATSVLKSLPPSPGQATLITRQLPTVASVSSSSSAQRPEGVFQRATLMLPLLLQIFPGLPAAQGPQRPSSSPAFEISAMWAHTVPTSCPSHSPPHIPCPHQIAHPCTDIHPSLSLPFATNL